MSPSSALTGPAPELAPPPRSAALLGGWRELGGPAIVLAACLAIALLAAYVQPHPSDLFCYTPAPTYHNCDLPLWTDLAQHPLQALPNSILANRPLFAWLGWLFAQPLRLVIPDSLVAQAYIHSAPFAVLAGLQLANLFCFVLSALFLYGFVTDLTGQARTGILAAVLWAASPFAFFWSYHPVNMMPGLAAVAGFSFFLFRLKRSSGYRQHLLFGLAFGLLIALLKSYLVFPLLYLAWGVYQRFRAGPLLAGLALCLLPYLLWPRLFTAYTGQPFVDYHFGAEGALGHLLSKLAQPDLLARETAADFLQTPKVLGYALGIPIVLAAVAFYLNKGAWRRYRGYLVYSGLYCALFFLALSSTGWYQARHGSDFFVLGFASAAVWLADVMKKIRPRWLLALGGLAYLAYFIASTSPAAFRFLGFGY